MNKGTEGIFNGKNTKDARKTSLKQSTLVIPGRVMAMKTLGGNIFAASISDIPASINLAEIGRIFFAKSLENFGSNLRRCKRKNFNR